MNNIDKDKDTLDELIEAEIVTVDEEGLPVKSKKGKVQNYNDSEVVAIILPYVYENISVSSREIARRTGLDARTVNKYRKSELFKTKLAELTNDKLLSLRCMALEELEKILKDKSINPNTKIKACHEILAHSVSVAEIAVQAGKEVKHIDINVLLKEIENM